MIRRLLNTLWFAAKSAVAAVWLYGILTGVSCFRHGDRGPYPEMEYSWLVPIVAMLLIHAFGREEQE